MIGLDEAAVTDRYVARLKAEGINTSRGTLYRLKKDVALAGGPIGLLDRRWSVAPADPAATDDRFAEACKRLWLTQHQRSIHLAAELAANEIGFELTDASYKAAQRILRAIPRETVVLYREGEKAFTNKVETHIDRDWSLIAANDLWCSDHHRLDVFVRYLDPRTGEEVVGRPWLHAWQDLRSRKIVGYRLFVGHDPNANVIVSVLTGSVKACYRPKAVLLDNGKDFDGRVVTGVTKAQRRRLGAERPTLPDGERIALGGVLSLLDVQVRHAWAYHGQTKPIERWFRTVSEQFSKLWDGYCGRDTLHKPEWIDERRRDGRLPTFDDVAVAFDDYVRGYNASPSLAADNRGRSPDEVWAESVPRDVVADELLEFARLTRVPVRVRQKAVVRLPGLDVSYGRGERPLIDRIGQDVILAYDPQHLETAWLCDAKGGNAICRLAARRDLHPEATEQDLRHAIAEKKQAKRRARDYMAARPRLALDAVELARLAAARRINRDREHRLANGTDDATALAGQPIALSPAPAALAAALPPASSPPPRDHAAAYFGGRSTRRRTPFESTAPAPSTTHRMRRR